MSAIMCVVGFNIQGDSCNGELLPDQNMWRGNSNLFVKFPSQILIESLARYGKVCFQVVEPSNWLDVKK